jgi:hypothetical protein
MGGHTGHNPLPSRTYQHGCPFIPVGVTPTGTESGECDTNRNPPLPADRPQHPKSRYGRDIQDKRGTQRGRCPETYALAGAGRGVMVAAASVLRTRVATRVAMTISPAATAKAAW